MLRAIPAGAIAVACALAGVNAPPAGAAKPPCWRTVIQDWSDGHVDGTYPAQCYRTAVEHLPEDLRTYSSAADDINRALFESSSRDRRSVAAAHAAPAAVTAGRDDAPGPSSWPLAARLLAALGVAAAAIGSTALWVAARRRCGSP